MNNEVSGQLIMKRITLMTHPNRLNEFLKQFYWMRKLQRINNITLLCASQLLPFFSGFFFLFSSLGAGLWTAAAGEAGGAGPEAVGGMAFEMDSTPVSPDGIATSHTTIGTQEKDQKKNKYLNNQSELPSATLFLKNL